MALNSESNRFAHVMDNRIWRGNSLVAFYLELFWTYLFCFCFCVWQYDITNLFYFLTFLLSSHFLSYYFPTLQPNRPKWLNSQENASYSALNSESNGFAHVMDNRIWRRNSMVAFYLELFWMYLFCFCFCVWQYDI